MKKKSKAIEWSWSAWWNDDFVADNGAEVYARVKVVKQGHAESKIRKLRKQLESANKRVRQLRRKVKHYETYGHDPFWGKKK